MAAYTKCYKLKISYKVIWKATFSNITMTDNGFRGFKKNFVEILSNFMKVGFL